MRLFTFVTLFAFGLLVQASNLDLPLNIKDDQCIQGCILPLSMVTFSDVPVRSSGSKAKCESKLYTASVLHCAEHYCSSRQFEAGWNYLSAQCGGVEVQVQALGLLKSLSSSDIRVINCVKSAKQVFNGTIEPTEENVRLGIRTVYTADRQFTYSHAFGWSLWLLCGAMCLGGVFLRFISWLSYRPLDTRSPSFRSELAPSTGILSDLYTSYRKYLGTPALFGHKHGQPAWWLFSVPTRLQGFWIFVYVALNIVFSCMGYEAFEGNMTWPDKHIQIFEYVSNRTAIMGFYNLPLLWLLAGRNDFLLWITGCSYSTLNLFHRWAARMFTLQAVTHSIGYVWLHRTKLGMMWEMVFWRAGIFAVICVVLMIPLSILPIRQKAYEVFLLLHIGLSVAALVLCFYHVSITKGQYNPWIWACVGIWAFDRLLRWTRLTVLSCNATTDNNAEATVSGGDHGLIRLTVTTPFKVRPTPGQHYFLYNPSSLTPWENHPFTLASWDEEGHSTKLNFLIAVKTGATRRLRRRITGTSSTKLRVLVEGPYGQTQPVERFEHVLFVAGGSGITATLPYLARLRDSQFTKSITLIWSVKNNAFTTDVLHRELAGNGAEIRIHVTEEEQPAKCILPALDHAANEENKAEETEKVLRGSVSSGHLTATTAYSPVSVTVGRPDMRYLLTEHTRRLAGSERLAVVACGPGAMMDDLRGSIVDIYGKKEDQVTGSQVEYFEELYAW